MDRKKLFLEETSKRRDEWRSAAQVVEELRRLAAEIIAGAVIIGGEKLPVGDSFSLVIKKQLKKGVVSCEFLLQTQVAEKAGSAFKQLADSGNMQKYPASGGKKLKKEISSLWKELVKHVNEESVAPVELGRELRRKVEDYNMSVNGQWADAWRRCAEKVKSCVAAAERGDFATAGETITEVNHQIRECHRLYK